MSPAKKPEFEDLLLDVHPMYKDYVSSLHDELIGSGCTLALKPASQGLVASYVHGATKKTLVNFVFRKSGMIVRIYGAHAADYLPALEPLPEGMRIKIKKAPVCRRMLDPTKCNPRCAMGYDFMFDGERLQKCRIGAFNFGLSEENNPHIRAFIAREIEALA
ncbi:hypothetical protein LJC32_04070 [Oscillospiraceae bacterium OttesenSCG-928-F05]|nr:hypothetical protein [Oscillospiraceae bacterium OttesenSCG-928-F05]